MSKALVIKNASFAANKVTTVTFNDVYCTGVSFSESSVTLDELGEATVEYTITPANTTDEVIFTSSDSSVASIADGDVVVNGIGTCTLNLRCGAYSDSCSITVDIYEDPILIPSYIVSATDTETSDNGIRFDSVTSRDYLVVSDSYSKGYFDEKISVRGDQYDGIGDLTAIKIPGNANTIHVDAKKINQNSFFLYFTNADETFEKNSRTYVKTISSVSLAGTYNPGGFYYLDDNITVPEGATGYVYWMAPKNSLLTDFKAITTEADLKTFIATNMELSVHYLHTDAEQT